MRIVFAVLPLSLLLVGCTPADKEYCNSFGPIGTVEYSKCLGYYHEQEAIFGNDRAACDLEADAIYPRTLYDNGRYQPVFYGARGFGGWPGSYGYGGVSNVYIEPDYAHNVQVDQLRLRLVGPCMDAKGWNSPLTWQAGRHAVTPVKKPRKTTAAKPAGSSLNVLPWLH